jgi:hypothetical protein
MSELRRRKTSAKGGSNSSVGGLLTPLPATESSVASLGSTGSNAGKQSPIRHRPSASYGGATIEKPLATEKAPSQEEYDAVRKLKAVCHRRIGYVPRNSM